MKPEVEKKKANLIAERKKAISRSAVLAQYSQRTSPPTCMCSDWNQLLAKLGLRYSELEALQALVKEMGLPAPVRKKLQ